MSLGSRLKALREKMGLTQKELANKTKLTIVQLSRYETDDRKPDPEALKKLASVLETSTDYLLGLTDISNPQIKGRAYFGGGDDWTEEERELARATIEAYRKKKKEIEERLNKRDV